MLCFKKPKASRVLPDLMSNKGGRFGRLTGTDLAKMLAFVALLSGSNTMVK